MCELLILFARACRVTYTKKLFVNLVQCQDLEVGYSPEELLSMYMDVAKDEAGSAPSAAGGDDHDSRVVLVQEVLPHITPNHFLNFLKDVVIDTVGEQGGVGRNRRDKVMMHGALVTAAGAASHLWRALGPPWDKDWVWDDARTQISGRGNPRLSNLVKKWLSAKKKKDLADGLTKRSALCIYSQDIIRFSARVYKHGRDQWAFFEAAKDRINGTESADGHVQDLQIRDALVDYCNAVLYGYRTLVHVLLTRVGHHRASETASTTDDELMATQYGLVDKPAKTKTKQSGTKELDENHVTHSGYGPYCNPRLKRFDEHSNDLIVSLDVAYDWFVEQYRSDTLEYLELCNRAEVLWLNMRKKEPHAAGMCLCCVQQKVEVLENILCGTRGDSNTCA